MSDESIRRLEDDPSRPPRLHGAEPDSPASPKVVVPPNEDPGSREVLPQPTLEQKYEGVDLAQLKNSAASLTETCRLVAEEIFAEMRARGQVETTFSATGEGPFIPSTFPDGSIRLSQWWSSPGFDGQMKFEVASVNPATVPELKDIHRELDWLRRRIRTLEAPRLK
ncbi:MAG: hypothetical protein IPK67_18295 [Planctomycetes bacterium]|nr:hypothetical protein [Planctomycetota bacterium]